MECNQGVSQCVQLQDSFEKQEEDEKGAKTNTKSNGDNTVTKVVKNSQYNVESKYKKQIVVKGSRSYVETS